jgi:hypothetical protein
MGSNSVSRACDCNATACCSTQLRASAKESTELGAIEAIHNDSKTLAILKRKQRKRAA